MVKANTNIWYDVNIRAISHIVMGSIIVSCVNIDYCSNLAVSSIVLPNINIGDYAMSAAASLAAHSIPDNQIFAGSPARYLKNISE